MQQPFFSRIAAAAKRAGFFYPAALFLLLAAALGLRYRSIGSFIGEDGILVEPFHLIPLSFLSACTGGLFLLIGTFRLLRTRARERRESSSETHKR